jgi:hypothetical protein
LRFAKKLRNRISASQHEAAALNEDGQRPRWIELQKLVPPSPWPFFVKLHHLAALS